MSEHQHTEPEADERTETVEDLDVPESDARDVAAGSKHAGEIDVLKKKL